ncbi:Hypothetical predicted protein, partial [Paramuricea clavata]
MKVSSEMKTGLQHTLHINNDSDDMATGISHDFDALSDNDQGRDGIIKSKVEMVLFLLDKFCIGDNFYHEMTMLFYDLPRSYLVKQKRTQLNEMCHITSTPGDEEGAQAEIALWFAWSFGLEVKSMKVSGEMKTGLQHTLHINNDSDDMVTGISHDFDALSDNDQGRDGIIKSKLEMVLFLLDKFCIGDNFYHEMTMLFDDLPRSYLVKQKRTQLNEMCHIASAPGDEEGAQ